MSTNVQASLSSYHVSISSYYPGLFVTTVWPALQQPNIEHDIWAATQPHLSVEHGWVAEWWQVQATHQVEMWLDTTLHHLQCCLTLFHSFYCPQTTVWSSHLNSVTLSSSGNTTRIQCLPTVKPCTRFIPPHPESLAMGVDWGFDSASLWEEQHVIRI